MADGTTRAGATGPQQVGRALRECREAFGRSLEEVAEATRIRPSYLAALETGDYSAFPGDFWARLFLRSYAQHLGLPPEEMIAEAFPEGMTAPPPVRLSPPAEAPPPPSAPAYRPRARGRAAGGTGRTGDEGARRSARRLSELEPRASRRQWASPTWAFIASIVVALLLAGIVYNLVHRGAAPTAAPPARTSGQGRGHGGAAGGQGAKGTGKGAKAPSSTGRGNSAPPPTHGYTTVTLDQAAAKVRYHASGHAITLVLHFTRPCWVGTTEGTSKAYIVSHTYQPGQSVTLTSSQTLHVRIGASAYASGSLNGQAIGPWTGGLVWDLTIEP